MTTRAVYSFDIFDTCLIRYHLIPIDVFLLWATRIVQQHNIQGQRYIQELASERYLAEQRARKKTTTEDVTLDAIYTSLCIPLWCSMSTQDLQKAEMEVERYSLRPIASTREIIQKLRQQGNTIAFISDMYLPTSFLFTLLQECHMACDGDSIYVSGDVGFCKSTGNLYRHVLQKENIAPKQLHHLGDNYFSDVAIPKRLGIHANWFSESQLHPLEKKLVDTSTCEQTVTSALVGIRRATRVMQTKSLDKNKWVELVAEVIAPVLTSYVAWVMENARERGIKRLYFVARDGQIMYKIAKRFYAKYPDLPECRYLYGSRQAWYLPGLENVSEDIMAWFIVDGHSKSPRDILAKLNIAPEEIQSNLIQHGFTPDTWDKQIPKKIQGIWKIIQEPEVYTLIQQKIMSARELTLAYLRQEGLCSGIPYALVDTGWTVRSQNFVRNILKTVGLENTMMGYYFGVGWKRLNMAQAGEYEAYLYSEHMMKTIWEAFFHTPYIRVIEQIFTISDHGSTMGYARQENGTIRPIFKPFSLKSVQKNFLDVCTKTIEDYSDLVITSGIFPKEIPSMRHTSLSILSDFFQNPPADFVEDLQWVEFGDDQNEARVYKLVKKLGISDVWRIAVYVKNRLQHGVSNADFPADYAWWEACLAISPVWIRSLWKNAIQLRRWLPKSHIFAHILARKSIRK